MKKDEMIEKKDIEQPIKTEEKQDFGKLVSLKLDGLKEGQVFSFSLVKGQIIRAFELNGKFYPEFLDGLVKQKIASKVM